MKTLGSRTATSLLVFGLVLFASAAAQSSDEPIVEWEKRQNADERLRAYGTDLLGDGIDPHTGSISFQHTDVSLPGNSHLEVAIRRKISQGEFYSRAESVEFGDWQLDVPRIEVLHMTGGFTGNRCSNAFNVSLPYHSPSNSVNFDYSEGVILNAPGAGSIQILEVTTLGPQWPSNATHVSTEGWWFKCVAASDGGQGFEAHAPNGDIYTLDEIIVRDAHSLGNTAASFFPRERTIIAASEVTDVHGNTVDYNYDSSGRLTSIVANDGRQITLGYNGASELIASATANGRSWTYAYSATTYSEPNWIANYTAASRQTLDSVTRPDNRSWSFDLDEMQARPGPGSDCIQLDYTLGITHPAGVQGDFDVSERQHRQSYSALTSYGVSCPTEPAGQGGNYNPPTDVTFMETMAVTSKTLTGPGIPAYDWSFSYEGDWAGTPGPINTLCMASATDPASECSNWTRVTEPDGRHITYFHLWNGEQLGGKMLLQEIRQDNNAGALLETADTEYLLEGAVGFSYARSGPSPVTIGTPARMAERTINRSGDTFSVDNTYVTNQSASNYSWGSPTKVERSTSLTSTKRITDTTYVHNTTKWVIGRVDTVSRNGTLFDDYDYDTHGRVITHKRFGSTWRTFNYHTSGAQAGRVSKVTDALGHEAELLNYKRGVPQQLIRPDNVSLYRTVDNNGWVTSGTNAKGDTTDFQFNNVGWLTRVEPPTNSGVSADTTIGYLFNTDGVEQTITKSNLETTVQYDAMLRPTLETLLDTSLPSSVTHSRTEYDSQGRPIFQSFPSSGTSALDGADTEYDALGRLTRTAQNVAPFAVTTTNYLSGYRVQVTDPRGYVTATDSIAFGAPGAEEVPIRIDTPLGADRVMTYDNFGNVLTETKGTSVTTYTYDSRNRLSIVTDPDNFVSSTYYDVNDRPIVTIDGAGRKSRTVYDNLNRPVKEIRAWAGNNNGSGATLDCNVMRTNTTNNPSQLQQCYREIGYTLTGQTDTVADANNNLTKYLYDDLEQQTHTYFPSKTTTGVHSSSDYEQITYNALGQPVSKRTRRADVIDYTHDALGRLIDRKVPGAPTHSANGRTVSHSYTHDAWGHIETATHDGETISYAYDAVGRVTSQTYAGNRTVGYLWDASNNLTRLTWPDSFVVDYAWDANNRVDQALDGSRVLADVAYDAQSRRQSVAYANGTNVSYTWSDRGDLTDHDHNFTGSSISYDFTYNGVGQTLSKTLSDPSYGWVAPTTGTDAYQVNGLNQYTSIDGAAPIYDGNGNLTTDHQGRSFSFDAENVMRSASGLTGGSATYRYHADGSRRQKTHNGSTSNFYYMGGLGYLDEADTAFAADQEIAEYSGAGALQKRFVRLPGSIDEAFMMIDVSSGSTVETWAHTDRLGSAIATTNSTGATNGTYRYSPYGKPGSEGPTGFPFRFTGQRLDAETGLYYYKARYYDPETGRFLQTDPIGYDDGMNMYAYVGNDPLNANDPSGMQGCPTRLNENSECFADRPNSEQSSPGGSGSGDSGSSGSDSNASSEQGGSDTLAEGSTSYYQYGCWMCPLFDPETGKIVGASSEFSFSTEDLLKHAVFDYVDAQNNGDTLGQYSAGSYLVALGLANDLGGRARAGRISKLTSATGPKFPNLKDHARRHSKLGAAAYYRSAVANMANGRPFKFRHDGMTKRGFVKRIGPNQLRFTSTTLSGKRIFTHMDVKDRYLGGLGITLPKGF